MNTKWILIYALTLLGFICIGLTFSTVMDNIYPPPVVEYSFINVVVTPEPTPLPGQVVVRSHGYIREVHEMLQDTYYPEASAWIKLENLLPNQAVKATVSVGSNTCTKMLTANDNYLSCGDSDMYEEPDVDISVEVCTPSRIATVIDRSVHEGFSGGVPYHMPDSFMLISCPVP